MNYELVEEAKNANKAKCTAIKLYEKSKEAVSRCLEWLQLKKDEKNQLKDELTHVLMAQESQQQVIQVYENMVQQCMSSKLSLKLEIKIGCRGGASWP